MDVTVCLRCSTRVIPKADGICPACGYLVTQTPPSNLIPAARRGWWRETSSVIYTAIPTLLLISLVGMILAPFLYPSHEIDIVSVSIVLVPIVALILIVYGRTTYRYGMRKKVRDARSAMSP